MFRIVIEKETPEAAYEELKRAAAALGQELQARTPAKAKKVGKPESAPAESASQPAGEPAGEPEQQPGAEEPAATPDKDSESVIISIDEVRAILGAKMKEGKGTQVNELVQSYAPALSKVPADKLAELLAKAKEL